MPSHVKNHDRPCCSRECAGIAKRIDRGACRACSKSLVGSKPGTRFCSKSCQWKDFHGTATDDRGRVCRDCEHWLPWSAFGKLKAGLNGRHAACVTCMNARKGLDGTLSRQRCNARCARHIGGPTTFPVGITCCTCGHWHPRSAYGFAPNAGRWNNRCCRCRATNERKRYDERGNTRPPRTGRDVFEDCRTACMRAAGLEICCSCRWVGDPSAFLNANRVGSRSCRFCTRAATLREKGVDVSGPQIREAWEAQGGQCASCSVNMILEKDGDGPTMHAHHCHDRLVFLDCLCEWCNMAEGLIRGCPDRARSLAGYIEQSGATPKDGPAELTMT